MDLIRFIGSLKGSLLAAVFGEESFIFKTYMDLYFRLLF